MDEQKLSRSNLLAANLGYIFRLHLLSRISDLIFKDTDMKENNGYGAKRRRNYKVISAISVTIFVVGLISFLDSGKSKEDAATLRQQRRSIHDNDSPPERITTPGADDDKGPNRGRSNSKKSQGGNKVDPKEKLVLSGKASLVNIRIPRESLSLNPTGNYSPHIMGVFCEINWKLHKNDPPAYPMFHDLHKGSHCETGEFSLPLRNLARKARSMDDKLENKEHPTRYDNVHTLQLKGVVFHESRCGSTLVANSMAAADPATHRVYSESPPPITAFKGCEASGESSCDEDLQTQLILDTMYFMSRSNDPKEKYLFLKIQSIGSTAISAFRRALPDIPYIFVYRDPVQVIMSHLNVPHNRILQTNCLRSFHRKPQIYVDVIQELTSKPYDELTPEEHCAAHMATIVESVKKEYTRDPSMGVMVDYLDLPNILITHIFPNHFHLDMTSTMKENILQVSGTYSKLRKPPNAIAKGNPKAAKMEDGKWESDIEKKEKMASPAVREAAKLLLQDNFEWMQEQSRVYKAASGIKVAV